ncbi:hypothetical protein AMS68_000084 [Peltaster fructicola]|uniref:Methyltransferase domain-containing protein n=1 Tax=Peltaster fructicola TaxID=286661 RepID=A0A6H0XIM1_9PEZI|nr:hypothetical protein AMS68_000084 [Peltaster fructicola]
MSASLNLRCARASLRQSSFQSRPFLAFARHASQSQPVKISEAAVPKVPSPSPTLDARPVPSAPARSRSAPDGTLYWVALGSILATPAIVYFYYEHRKEHMRVKKEQMLNDTLDINGRIGAVQEQDILALLAPKDIKFFEDYIGIQQDQIVAHVSRARAEAWTAGLQYPSVSALTWLRPYLAHHPAHDEVLQRIKAGASILDCGCMFAPDLRYLAYSGAPTENMTGFDIEGRFLEMSYDYYCDRDRFHAKLIKADFFDKSPDAPLKSLEGSFDIVWTPKFVHLFDRPTQIDVCVELIKLLRPVPDSLFLISQNGYPEAKEMQVRGPAGNSVLKSNTFFLGNESTSREIWAEVERRTSTKWDFSCRLLDLRTIGFHKDDGSEYKRITGHNLQWIARRL